MASCVVVNGQNQLEVTVTPVSSCTGLVVLDVADYNNHQNSYLASQFDQDLADTVFIGMLEMFAVGLGVGMIIMMLKKLR